MRNTSLTTLIDNKLNYLEISNDQIIQLENENIEYRLNDIFIFESLTSKEELKVGDVYYIKSLDRNETSYDKNTNHIEANNVTIDGIAQKYYKIESIITVDGEESYTTLYGNAERIISFNMNLGDGFVINFRLESKEDAAKDLSYVADLYILNLIHLDETYHNKNIFDEIFQFK